MPLQGNEHLSDRVYVVQVLTLFSSVTASVVMAGIFLFVACIAYEKTGDPDLVPVGIVGCLLNAWRIGTSIVLRRQASAPTIGRAVAARFEALFAVPYVSFALLLGAFGTIIFRRPETGLHMLTICVLVGYCAGVAASCGLRPRIALSSILLAIGPAMVAALAKGDDIYIALAFIAAALTVGAARSIMVRYAESRSEIATRISSATQARRDVLTLLPNRLALDEFFSARMALCAPDTKIAVHYLDLDGFKPVNDKYGHAVGDQMLLAVAGRLRDTVRKSDMTARLGGDEFAIVQFGIRDPEEAHTLARRVRDAVHKTYNIDGHSLSITTSIGTCISVGTKRTLDDLLRLADAELYGVKRDRDKPKLTAVL